MPRRPTSHVVSLFTDLAAIPSPSGSEREVADAVTRYLNDLGVVVREDDAGPKIGSSSGNLLARLPPNGNSGVPVFFCAHLDTVPPDGPIQPVVRQGVVRNAAHTILGADNKAAVAVMLAAVRRIVTERRLHAGIELLFTAKEETGSDGAKVFDVASLQARSGFVFDHAGPIGDVVVAAPFHKTITAVFTGRAAHAGINPEDGRSAVAAASRAVAGLQLGRVDQETTVNIGRIAGGTARNVVPDRCQVDAEARSRDEEKLTLLVEKMIDGFDRTAATAGCHVETTVEDTYPGYRFGRGDQPLELAVAALEEAGFEPRLMETDGGADANCLNGNGLACLNLCNGMAQLHGPDEHISVVDLEAMVEVVLNLVHGASVLRHA